VREAAKLFVPWILYRLIWTPVIRFIYTQSLLGGWHMWMPYITFVCGCLAMLASVAVKGRFPGVLSALVAIYAFLKRLDESYILIVLANI